MTNSNFASPQHSPSDWSHHTENGTRIYAVGDIHGELGALTRLLGLIDADLAHYPTDNFNIVFLGDLVDRGENSRGVIDLVMELARSGSVTVLRGNHEQMLLSALEDSDELLAWRQYGGIETLMSFGIPPSSLLHGKNIDEVRQNFILAFGEMRLEFIRKLPINFHCGDYFFCHAGIRPNIPLDRQEERDLLWIRDPFLTSTIPHPKFIVHGHSPVETIEFKSNRINIDTGAYLTGRLSCVVLEQNRIDAFDSKSTLNTRISYR